MMVTKQVRGAGPAGPRVDPGAGVQDDGVVGSAGEGSFGVLDGDARRTSVTAGRGPEMQSMAGPGEDAPADEVITVTVESDDPTVVVLRVAGEVDMLTTPLLRSALLRQLDQGVRLLVVDLQGVTFLGSSGLGVLVEALKAARRQSAILRLVCTTRAVTRPLDVTGLNQVFELHETVEAATADRPGS